ncbi:hypothetical protein KME66_20400 [Streptomyces sp. YPW6]|uniref:hypothetical protein n=1 Tax=Streptomyces sp. YPW6 TaxID=2840373 RepID=UPI001C0D8266|nr:hypothetical protein [Streptomyces sp. YPW6]QWQ43074.1 hypothetical protein KME66_20400 [Streptomyces sp. YPW6]
MDKIFNRTENGTTTTISIREGLAELNHAMMGGRREVRSMSSGRTQHSIEYKDGRKVTLTLTDAPEPDTEPAEWATAHSGFTAHRFRDGRALCRKNIRPRSHSLIHGEYRTRSWVVNSTFTLCPRCGAL